MPTLRVLTDVQTAAAEKKFAGLTAQVEALNKEMAKTALIPAGGSPKGYTATTAALGAAGRAYNEALAASDAFRVETLKVNDVIAKQTDLLRRQKLGFRDIWGSRAARQRMAHIRQEQQALRNMTLRAVEGGIGDGHLRATLAIPKHVPKSWDTLTQRVGMFSTQLASASRVLLNFGKNTQWAGRQLMAGITYPMAAFGAAAGVMAYKVDKELTRITKVYNTTADLFSANVEEQIAAEQELAAVRVAGAKTAMQAAQLYGSSVTDTLGVQAELAATGQKGMELQAATTEVMKSAMLGEIDYQTATKATIALQQTLNMSSQELAETWAYMNSVENQTSLTMADFAQAIPIALGPLKQMGGTVQDLGTLLTAMVARGVQVGKAANAIKATAQRLVRPSKQVQEEFKAITGADITEIGQRNQSNLLGMLQDIYQVTKDLDEYDKTKAFAGLFGSYQLATMSAMIDGMGDLEKGIGQVTTAYQVGGDSAEAWGEVQRQEIEQWQESASGKFKIALETIKASLAEVGEPFLEVATVFLDATTKMLNLFNALPSRAKNILMFAGIFTALAGPVLMLVGLFGNLIANFGLIAAGALKLVTRFNLLNKAEWAQTKLDALYEKQLYSTASAVQLQTQEIKALTAAMTAHNSVMQKSLAMVNPAFGMNNPNFLGMPTTRDPMHNKAAIQNLMAPMWNSGSRRYHDPASGKIISQAAAEQRAMAVYAQQIAASQGLATRSASENLRIQQKTQSVLSGSNVAMGAMAASTVMMVQPWSETLQTTGQWLLLLSIGVPAVKGLVAGMGALSTKTKAVYAEQMAIHKASVANYGAMSTMGRVTGKTGAAMKGIKVAALGIMGPIGWTVAALGTTAFIVKKLMDHEKAITKEKREQANAMYDQNALLHDQLKITPREQGRLSVTGIGYREQGLPDPSTLADEMKDNNAYKPLIDQLKNEDTMQVERDAIVLNKYRDVLESTGGTAQKAQLYIEAMFRAAGDGALEAERKAAEYAASLGQNFGSHDLQEMFTLDIASIFNDDDIDSIEEQGRNIGKDLADAIASGGHENAQKNLDEFIAIYEEQVPDMFSTLNDSVKEKLAEIGVTSNETLTDIILKWQEADNNTDKLKILHGLGISPLSKEAAELLVTLDQVAGPDGPLSQMGHAQEAIVKELAAQLGIEKDIATFKELQATWEWQLATVHKGNAKNLYNQRLAEVGMWHDVNGNAAEYTYTQKLALANQILANAGLGHAETLLQAMLLLSGKTADEVANIGKAARGSLSPIQQLMNSFSFNDNQMKDILKAGMQGVQSDLADAASETFDNRMNAAIDSAQTAWDKRIDAMNRRHEDQMDAFDKRWERRKDKVEESYDAQIEGIDKVIEREQKAEDMRQKIFDAEMARIERMNEMANANIDFNMAIRTGELDEAAKIQNNMESTVMGWALGDAGKASEDKAAAREEQLNDQKETLEELKDKRLDAMEEEEAQQRKHLERMQENREQSLQQQSEAAMDAMRANWEAEKENLNDRLELFKSYTAMNKRDLKRWLDEVGLSYDAFGDATMMKGETWAGAIQKSLKKHVRQAGMEMANDQIWEAFGAKTARKTLLGMGFGGMKDFKRFMLTGELPADFGKNRSGRNNNSVASSSSLKDPNFELPPRLSRHGSGGGGSTHGTGGGRPTGPAGLMGALVKGLSVGVGKGFANAFNQKTARGFATAFASTLGADVSKFIAGPGGLHMPSDPGKGWSTTHDYSNPTGSPLYAFNDATVVESRAIRSGGGTKYAGQYPGEYTSYGETLVLRDDAGNTVRYAHLDKGGRFVRVGQRVPGGSLIGRSGWTGNASGPHTHFEFNGSYGAQGLFEQYGIGMNKGGYTKRDTPAVVHKEEMVIDKKRTKKLYSLVDNVAEIPNLWTWLSGLPQLAPNSLPVGPGTSNGSPSGSDVVRTGTYNISWRSDPRTTPGALEKLMRLTDVLSLQEVYGNRVGLVRKVLNDGGWGMSSYKDDSLVAYNRSKYSMLNSGNRGMNPNKHGGGVHRNRNAAWALLKGQGGQEFYQLSAHTNPMFGQMHAGGTNYDIQRAQYGTLTDMVREFSKRAPVILGGDLNWELDRPGGIPIANLVSVLAGKKGIDGMHTHAGGGDVDHIMFGPGSKLISSRIVGGLPSDHNALLSEIALPSLAKGAQNIRWDNTLANLHKGESVLTEDLTSQFKQGVENFANGGDAQYNVTVNVATGADPEEIADVVESRLKRMERRKPTRRTNR